MANRKPPACASARRRVVALAAGALAVAAASGCTPAFDWREQRPPQARCAFALPGRPQTAQREFEFAGRPLTMRLASAGVGATLFSVGVLRLPLDTLDDAQIDAALDRLRDGLLRNVRGRLAGSEAPRIDVPAGRRLRRAQGWRAAGSHEGRPALLAARFYVVDDLLYQLAALGREEALTAERLDTFFASFRLLP